MCYCLPISFLFPLDLYYRVSERLFVEFSRVLKPCVTGFPVVISYISTGVVNIDRPTKRVAVKAGTLLKHLNKQLRRNGLGLSNLPTLGDQTIGGALAVGKH